MDPCLCCAASLGSAITARLKGGAAWKPGTKCKPRHQGSAICALAELALPAYLPRHVAEAGRGGREGRAGADATCTGIDHAGHLSAVCARITAESGGSVPLERPQRESERAQSADHRAVKRVPGGVQDRAVACAGAWARGCGGKGFRYSVSGLTSFSSGEILRRLSDLTPLVPDLRGRALLTPMRQRKLGENAEPSRGGVE